MDPLHRQRLLARSRVGCSVELRLISTRSTDTDITFGLPLKEHGLFQERYSVSFVFHQCIEVIVMSCARGDTEIRHCAHVS